jgi:natural product precursor
MKKLNKIKLNQINKETMSSRQMNEVRGGAWIECSCSCYYTGNDISGISTNCDANYISGYDSTKGVERCFWVGSY